ncbi:hypothetical protein F5146DRAFT_1056968 [Armillaria mellea]|nr:hypothetical protein F5146DRAFT_1056968 [Armillaria mellea]
MTITTLIKIICVPDGAKTSTCMVLLLILCMQEHLGAPIMPDLYPKAVDNDQDNGARGSSPLPFANQPRDRRCESSIVCGSIATQACARPKNKGKRASLDTRAEKIKCKVEEEIQGLGEGSNAECERWSGVA